MPVCPCGVTDICYIHQPNTQASKKGLCISSCPTSFFYNKGKQGPERKVTCPRPQNLFVATVRTSNSLPPILPQSPPSRQERPSCQTCYGHPYKDKLLKVPMRLVSCIPYPLLCNKFSQNLEPKTTNIDYLIVSEGQESGWSLSGCLWLEISHVVTLKLLTGTTVIWRLDWGWGPGPSSLTRLWATGSRFSLHRATHEPEASSSPSDWSKRKSMTKIEAVISSIT